MTCAICNRNDCVHVAARAHRTAAAKRHPVLYRTDQPMPRWMQSDWPAGDRHMSLVELDRIAAGAEKNA